MVSKTSILRIHAIFCGIPLASLPPLVLGRDCGSAIELGT